MSENPLSSDAVSSNSPFSLLGVRIRQRPQHPNQGKHAVPTAVNSADECQIALERLEQGKSARASRGESADSEHDYDVGYCRPPKKHQFQKGCSGNPRGRPKNSKNFATIVQEAAFETQTVRLDGKATKVTAVEVMVLQLRKKAMAGDERAAHRFFELLAKTVPLRVEPDGAEQIGGMRTSLSQPDERDLEQLSHLLKEGAAALGFDDKDADDIVKLLKPFPDGSAND